MMAANESDLMLAFKSCVQKFERERVAYDALQDAKFELIEAWQMPDPSAEVDAIRERIRKASSELRTARTLADLSRKIAKDVLYPEGPKLVQQESAA